MLNLRKRLFICLLFLLFLFPTAQIVTASEVEINFARALQLSLYFYDANKCGPGITGGRLEWRGDCHLEDKKRSYEDLSIPLSLILTYRDIFDPDGDGYIDFSGGFHDAGDHVKFGLPQSYSASTLGWGYYEFKEAFRKTGQEEHMLEILKAFSDYFLKCTFLDENGEVIAFAYMVGEGTVDHSYWGPPELQSLTDFNVRPVDFAYADDPASDQCAGASAALTLMYLNYKDIDQAYAEECLEKAIALYEFARKYRGLGRGDGFYPSSGYYDELSWAAVWLYVATGNMEYIDHIMAEEDGRYVGYLSDIIETTENTWQNIWTHCWDTVWGGVFTKLATLFPENELLDYLARWNLEYWTGGQVPHEDPNDTNYLQPSPAGYACINTWGSARYNTAAQLLCLVYQKYNPERTDLTDWARGQMEYLMGNNPMGYSYIVGYGEKYAQHPHHRAAHGSKTNSMEDPVEHRHILWGALVGGPDESDYHVDLTTDYVYNEVAIDFNAAFVGALAGHYLLYGEGHEPLEDFPPSEGDVLEFYSQARLEQENNERTQVTITLTNDAVHPPRTEDGLSIRYFFDISELVAAGQSIADVSYAIYYDENAARYDGPVQTRGPVHWADNTYYIEIFWTGYQVYGDREVQLALMAAQDANWKSNWDPANDYSRQGIGETNNMTPRIPVYIDGILVYGEEPPAAGKAPAAPELSATVYEDARMVRLEWNRVEDAEGYRILWRAEKGVPGTEIIDVGDNNSYMMENLVDNNTYYFEVQAYNRYGVSPSSNVVRVTIGTSGDFTPGDINDDGRVDSLDYVLLRRYVLGIIREFDSEKGKLAADINQDGFVDSLDYILLRRNLVGE